MTGRGLVFAKSRRPLAASTGSPATKASAVGPVNSVVEAGDAGIRRGTLGQRVLRDRVAWSRRPATRRSVVSCVTVRPRYSVSTVARRAPEVLGELGDGGGLVGPNRLVRHVPPLSLLMAGQPRHGRTNEKRPGAGRTGRGASFDRQRTVHSLRGPSARVRNLRPTVRRRPVTSGLTRTARALGT